LAFTALVSFISIYETLCCYLGFLAYGINCCKAFTFAKKLKIISAVGCGCSGPHSRAHNSSHFRPTLSGAQFLTLPLTTFSTADCLYSDKEPLTIYPSWKLQFSWPYVSEWIPTRRNIL